MSFVLASVKFKHATINGVREPGAGVLSISLIRVSCCVDRPAARATGSCWIHWKAE